MLGAKADRIGEVAGVGAAAHGEGLGVLAGDLIVSVDAGLDGRAVGFNIERLGSGHILQLGTVAQSSADLLFHGLAVGAGGEAAVHGLINAAILHIDAAADDGQRAEGAVGAVDAQTFTCGGSVQLADGFQISALGVVAQAVVQQVVCHQTNGVHGAFRHGGMTGLAPAADAHAVTFRFQRDVGGILQLGDVGLDQCTGAVRHGVVGHTALKVHDHTVAHRADDLGTEQALFAVAHRELRIRGEAEGRGRVVLQVVVHILHVGLLVVACQRTDGVAQLIALLLEELQGIQGSHHGALVVGHAAAQQPAVLDAHGEGVGGPAVAHRYHVHMADGSQILLGVLTGQLGVSDVVLAVAGGKAHPGCQLQRLIQRCARACAEGCTLLGGAFHAVDGHQSGDILQQLLFVLRNVCVDFLIQCLIHDLSRSFLSGALRRRFQNTFYCSTLKGKIPLSIVVLCC